MNVERAEGYQINEVALLIKTGLPEGQLLLSLSEEDESWLVTLLKRVAEPAERIKSQTQTNSSSSDLIALVPTDLVEENVLVRQVLTEFKEYIESVRVRHIEW
jgi:hypothetical protein